MASAQTSIMGSVSKSSAPLTSNTAVLKAVAKMGYDGVELAVRDPGLVDAGQIKNVVLNNGLTVPAIGTGQAWGEEGLSFTSNDLVVRTAAIERIASHVPLADELRKRPRPHPCRQRLSLAAVGFFAGFEQ